MYDHADTHLHVENTSFYKQPLKRNTDLEMYEIPTLVIITMLMRQLQCYHVINLGNTSQQTQVAQPMLV